jgi:molybdopterin/thiamine biosynthesis adenylyltransferase
MSKPIKDSIGLIAETLIKEGFQLVPGVSPSFVGSITEGGVKFELSITNIDPTFMKLPTVKLINRPAALPTQLSNISSDNTLCYLDRLGVFLDPFQPTRTIQVIIQAIKLTLKSYADPSKIQQNFAGEFWAYWMPICNCCLTTDQSPSLSCYYLRKNLNGKEEIEHVITADRDTLDRWVQQRRATSLEEKTIGQAVVLSMQDSPRIDINKNWPPKTWSEFSDWLHRSHPQTEHQLLKALKVATKESPFLTIVINSEASGPFGVRIEFSQEIEKLTNRFRTKISSKNRSNLFNKFRSLIRSDGIIKSFSRLKVLDVTEKFVNERNLQTPSLRNKKIAILGCGTIGSQTAQLLVKAGAGTGKKGALELYDGDTLSSANLGRHLLGVEYLFESKADAIADFLYKNAASAISINGNGNFNYQNIQKLHDYDLIIDATGEETFSTLLAYKYHQVCDTNKRFPPILHAWIDANGHAVRALLDDNTGACYRCLKIQKHGVENGVLAERFPLFKNLMDEEKVTSIAHRCGESYIPFAAGASSIASGILQQMTLEAMNNSSHLRFRHYGFSSMIRVTRDQNPHKIQDCPCCRQGRT